jgi:hypothetical protein
MPVQFIKTTLDAFMDIQAGRRSAVIVKNDRIWSTYDEIFFVECDKQESPTGRMVRMGVNTSQFGEFFGLAPAHQILFLRPIDREPEPLPVENASREEIEAAIKQNETTLRSPHHIKQGILY